MNLTMEQENRCGLCSKTFRQKSSLVRHAKKCTLEPRPSLRQKACQNCTAAKSRCDLMRPTCSRCASRGSGCVYLRPVDGRHGPVSDPSAATAQDLGSIPPVDRSPFGSQDSFGAGVVGGPSSLYDFADLGAAGALTPGFFSSSEDSLDLSTFLNPSIGSAGSELMRAAVAQNAMPNAATQSLDEWLFQAVSKPPVQGGRDAVLQHSMRTIFRVLRSWPRMLAKGFQLPPIIHLLQFKDGTPRPLANCISLCKMWSGQCDASTGPIVEDAVRKEVDVILGKYKTYDQPTLLSALQSIVIYLLLLIFPTPTQTSQSLIPPSLFTQIQALGYYVSSTGLILHEETTRTQPAWTVWAQIEAKRRAMCSLYLVHWAYSIYHSQVRFDCGRELARMPGPGAKFLWNATDERTWNALYARWLAQWDEGRDFMFAEFVGIDQGVVMNRRAEIWLEDADELGFLMLSLVNATERNTSRVTDEG